jgi:hypothetical protein
VNWRIGSLEFGIGEVEIKKKDKRKKKKCLNWGTGEFGNWKLGVGYWLL